MWKFKSWKGKDKYVFLLSVGVMLCILAFPAERLPGLGSLSGKQENGAQQVSGAGRSSAAGSLTAAPGDAGAESVEPEAAEAAAEASAAVDYEKNLEKRVAEILSHVDGVGTVDVMIVLKASAERVIHVDTSSTRTLEEEKDSAGINRTSQSESQEQTAVLTDGGSGRTPVIEKEIYPEISGIVVSASGGGNPTVRAEISATMEALFGLPANKIKVLKRVE